MATLTIGPYDATVIWGGYVLHRGIGGTPTNIAAEAFYGGGTEVRFGFTGTQVEANIATEDVGTNLYVSIDGGAPTSTPLAVVDALAWTTLATGLTDAAHTITLAITGSGGQNTGVDPTNAFRITGAAPSTRVFPGYEGTIYPLDGSNDAGIVPDTGAKHGGAFQGYPNYLNFIWDLASIRFRARCSALLFWGYNQSENFALTIDGVDQAPVSPSTPNGGRAWGWIYNFAGLDDTAYHDYILRRVWEGAAIPFATPVLYQLLAHSTTGGNINLASPPAIPAPSLVGFGDSITEAVQVAPADSRDGYAYLLAKDLGADPINRGINGTSLHDYTSQGGEPWNATTGSGEARAAADIGAIAPVPAVCVEIYGVNDLTGNTGVGGGLILSQAGMQTACQNMYSAILTAHPGIRILAVGILPIAGPGLQTVRSQFNAGKQAAVAATQLAFPSSKIAYLNPDGWIDPGTGTYPTAGSVDTVDGLHPNVSGHTKIAAKLLLALYALTATGGGVGGGVGTLSLGYPLAATGGGGGGLSGAATVAFALAGLFGGVGGASGMLTPPPPVGHVFTSPTGDYIALELPGSPAGQESLETRTYYWNPAPRFVGADAWGAPTASVYGYDPYNPNVAPDVGATVLAGGSPFLGVPPYANMVGVTLHRLTPGVEYRVAMTVTGSEGSVLESYFRVRCLI